MDEFKVLLNKKKIQLEESLVSIKESSKPVSLSDPIGRITRMDAIERQQINLHSKNQIEMNLLLINQALKRIEQKSYGICVKCEEEIDRKRLLAKPETPFCIKCQR